MLICTVNHFKDYFLCSSSQTYLIIEPFSNDYPFEKCPLTGQTLVPASSIEISSFHHNHHKEKFILCSNTLNNRKAENFKF